MSNIALKSYHEIIFGHQIKMLREGRGKAICLQPFPLPSLLQPSFMGKRGTRSSYKTPLIHVRQGSIEAFLDFFLDISDIFADDIRNTSNQHLDGSM